MTSQAIFGRLPALCTARQLTFRVFGSRAASGGTVSQRTKAEPDHYDIIIAGGGMVGCSLTCALAKNPKLSSQRVLLLEGSPQQNFTLPKNYSNRVSALNHGSQRLLARLGAWARVEDMRLQAVHRMQVWDSCSDAWITFDGESAKKGDIAFIVENDILLHAINEELTSPDLSSTVTIQYGAKVAGYRLADSVRSAACSTVILDNGRTYSCNLLVGADGAGSRVRAAMGTRYLLRPYDQLGLVATVGLDKEADGSTAWQRFLPDGPVALLPLAPGLSSLVWSAPPERARRLLQASDADFLRELNSALARPAESSGLVAGALGALDALLGARGPPPAAPIARELLPGSRALFPLASGHSARYVAPGVALVGDAAHRVHPLAGQGVNLGFGDVACLARLLGDSLYSGRPTDDKSTLLQYETQRQRHVLPMAAAIHALQRLYSSSSLPVVLARSLGLQVTHAITPLKRALMHQAMAS